MRNADRKYWQEYIRQRIKVDRATGCWLWQLYCTDLGYGRCAGALPYGLSQLAHRVAYEAFKGPIPAGKQLRHQCHNPPCCNPEHMLPGTHKDNKEDDVRDKPIFTGSQILTAPQVLKIRRLLKDRRLFQREIGALFGVTQATISRIKHNESWKHI